ncbi:hypothetical protein PAAG_11327 [Paracoccidioides lutzii Pb01]|uniref:Uncharacterized protein n=1 Tax=Paracoccidioides lutzii (strain ATCC MYA-826 / Pb01) TaxID=502779 RepID=A0A0A2V2A3_PARBA|nr:hypothetical protein PAAG_11327 [Paracoccidioides lutzii Pb01]KGQ01936.1 hypothetical protein PAAG_11327 [Paracoccidioides lutzii Pb01]
MPDEFEELKRGVWETIFKGVSTALGDLKANIQMSVTRSGFGLAEILSYCNLLPRVSDPHRAE